MASLEKISFMLSSLIFTSFHKVNPLLLAINILTTPIKPGRFLQMDQQVVVVCRC